MAGLTAYSAAAIDFIIISISDDRSVSDSVPPPTPTSTSNNDHHQLTVNNNNISSASSSLNTTTTAYSSTPADGADSGIGSDSPKLLINNTSDTLTTTDSPIKMKETPPEVPPKPRRESLTGSFTGSVDPDDPMRSAYEDSTIGRDHSVLPAHLRPTSSGNKIPVNGSGGNGKESYDNETRRVPTPDLGSIPKDRYDPASKCFSYVPAKSLREHYTAPKKPAKRRPSKVEPVDLEAAANDPSMAGLTATESLRKLNISVNDLTRREESPKWEQEIDKLTGDFSPKNYSDFPQRGRRSSASEVPHLPPPEDPIYNKFHPDSAPATHRILEHSSRALPNGYLIDKRPIKRGDYYPREERPLVVEQARRAVPNLVKSAVSNDMDALLDPSFYLTYAPPPLARLQSERSPSPVEQWQRTKSAPHFSSSSGETRREPPPPRFAPKYAGGGYSRNSEPQKRPVRERELDELNDFLASTTLPIPMESHQKSKGPDAAANRAKPEVIHEAYRDRNSRSVNSTPFIKRERKLFAHDNYDAVNDSENVDDWLFHKLRALQSKRYMQPDAQKRRNTERILLEELKNVTSARGGGRAQHTPRREDALVEYKREEERLRNTGSPFVDELRLANRRQQQRPRPQPQRSLSVTPTSEVSSMAIVGRGGTVSVTPISSTATTLPQSNRRGGGGGQIVTGKPPTPPLPSSSARERSRSPALHISRRSQAATPPAATTAAAPVKRTSSAPTTPQAIREYMYQKERSRLGLGGEGGYASDNDDDYYAIAAAQGGGTSISSKADRRPWHHPTTTATATATSHGSDLTSPAPSSSLASVLMGGGGSTAAKKSILKRHPTNESNSTYIPYGTNTPDDLSSVNGSSVVGRERDLYAPLNNRGIQRAEIPYEESPRSQRQPPYSTPASASASSTPIQQLYERGDTPAFPIGGSGALSSAPGQGRQGSRGTPLPYHPLLYEGADDQPRHHHPSGAAALTHRSGSYYGGGGGAGESGLSRRSSMTSIEGAEIIRQHPLFVKDTSKYWYKPTITREDAISMLKDKPAGTFVIRDSNSFPGAFGLALKVAQPPAGVVAELVRHFLIEPSPKGVRLKGCNNEPVFGTLSALIYQHSITPLALPCRLIMPDYDPSSTPEHLNSNQALLERGAACNVTYLCSVDTESLTGPEALRRSVVQCFDTFGRHELRAVPVHFKVSSQGITLTDNTRTLFFRRHYPVNSVTYAGIDPESRLFDNNNVTQLPPTYVRQAPIFGFVARKFASGLGLGGSGTGENACHLFAELDPDQPASAVIRFISNVMMPAAKAQLHQIHRNQQ